jgi:hypothetical protein
VPLLSATDSRLSPHPTTAPGGNPLRVTTYSTTVMLGGFTV